VFRARATAREGPAATPARLQQALELAERAVRLAPVNAPARESRALARLNSGDVPGAYVDLAVAARLHPLEPRYAESRDQLRQRLPAITVGARAGS
jgi:Flp pilus assembly protein TadD